MNAFIPNGEKIIQKIIGEAKSQGLTNVVISGDYLINDTVLIPSDTTLILDDCHLRLADGTFCNMFRNENCYAQNNRTRDGADKNIKIIGVGRAILDGGEYNGLSERNYRQEGRPHIYNNNTLLFSNVDGFEIKNLKVINQRYWAFNFIFCRYGKICDIDFLADFTRIDKDGNRVKGLDRSERLSPYVKNADGIDLRIGCHDIIIENITGFTEDDTVALTALPSESALRFSVKDEPIDIYNVTIKNIVTAAFCSNVRLLNQGLSKIYNILIDGVQDASGDGKYYVGRGSASVRIGDLLLYGERQSTKDETFNISIKNVFSRADFALSLVGEMTDVNYENIYGFDGCPVLIDDMNAKIYKKGE